MNTVDRTVVVKEILMLIREKDSFSVPYQYKEIEEGGMCTSLCLYTTVGGLGNEATCADMCLWK